MFNFLIHFFLILCIKFSHKISLPWKLIAAKWWCERKMFLTFVPPSSFKPSSLPSVLSQVLSSERNANCFLLLITITFYHFVWLLDHRCLISYSKYTFINFEKKSSWNNNSYAVLLDKVIFSCSRIVSPFQLSIKQFLRAAQIEQ